MKRTVVLGATDNPARYAYKAVLKLQDRGHEVYPVGIRKSTVGGISIINDKNPIENIHTITLYIGPANQPAWYDYILSLKPKRLIFNPGTENEELKQLAESEGIETLEDCTLVMLAIGHY